MASLLSTSTLASSPSPPRWTMIDSPRQVPIAYITRFYSGRGTEALQDSGPFSAQGKNLETAFLYGLKSLRYSNNACWWVQKEFGIQEKNPWQIKRVCVLRRESRRPNPLLYSSILRVHVFHTGNVIFFFFFSFNYI